MKVTTPNNTNKDKSTHHNVKNAGMKTKLIFLVLSLSLLSLMIGIYILGTGQVRNRVISWARSHGHNVLQWPVNHGHNALRKDISLKQALVRLPKRVFESFNPLNENIPKINIDIKFKHIQKIHQKRNKAMSDGILVQGPDDFVPAVIRYNNDSIL